VIEMIYVRDCWSPVIRCDACAKLLTTRTVAGRPAPAPLFFRWMQGRGRACITYTKMPAASGTGSGRRHRVGRAGPALDFPGA
jgi:hypothetical protein